MGKLSRKNFWSSLIASFFGCGYFPWAQGTITSLVTIIIWLIINKAFYLLALDTNLIILIWFLLIIILFLVGTRSAETYSKEINNPDPKQVVIDEVVGQLISLVIAFCCISFDLAKSPINNFPEDNLVYFYSLLSLVLFRFFDISKPFYIGFIDQNIKGGIGIMLDDVAAGITAGFCICCFYISTLIL